jgi:hypothetical protein
MERTRTENLLLHDRHVGLDISEDGRLDEVPLGAVLLATEKARCSLLFSNRDVIHDPL